jgi:uncharacterized protein VirK/YbjX
LALPLAGEPLGQALAGRRQIVDVLNAPSTRRLEKKCRASHKYLTSYLAKPFDKVMRRGILLHHYRYMAATTPPDFHDRIVDAPFVLWRHTGGRQELAITLKPNLPHEEELSFSNEGELSLVFLAAGINIFELSFTIAPGGVAGSTAKDALVIGRIQGGRRYDLIKIAVQMCRQVSPKYLLMAAAQGIAQVLGLGALIGPGNETQVYGRDDPLHLTDYVTDYNAFWETLHATRTAQGFYELPLPFPETPLSELALSHRRRTRLKREFKDAVRAEVARSFATDLLKRV